MTTFTAEQNAKQSLADSVHFGLEALAGKEPTKVSNPVFQSYKNSLT